MSNENKDKGYQGVTEIGSVPAYLVLADGRIFRGFGFGAIGTTLGEAVFTTAMTGYQETMTDPSYHRQIVVATAPQIGNTGWNDEDNESRDGRIWVAGLVIRDLAARVSNWRATTSLQQEMADQGIVGIGGIDTRALVRHIRNEGAIAAGIFSGVDAERPVAELIEIVQNQPPMAGANLVGEVTVDAPVVVPARGGRRFTVAAIDLGIKDMTPQLMAARGLEVHILPASSTLADIRATGADGVFFSNGPGDPAAALDAVRLLTDVLDAGLPYFGICFGNQIFGRALGFGTYKLTYGHRGLNVPVLDRATGAVEITAQNHGFAVDAPLDADTPTRWGDARVTHVCLNDDVVEGLELTDASGRVLGFSVQYHPEAAAGPHDSVYLFDRFVAVLASTGAAIRTEN